MKVGNKVFYSQNIKFKTIYLGDEYQGGLLAYIFTASDHGYVSGETHGFIIAKSNLPNLVANIMWSFVVWKMARWWTRSRFARV